MKKIIQMQIDFYNNITNGKKKWIGEELKKQKISILTGFIKNADLVKAFYEIYYSKDKSRIVLCGINPGRFGAGKTGVPFLDYKSLSKLLHNINGDDVELSAQFIFDVINNFGYENFFDNVYLTNISWFGFTKDNNNFNYYDLSEDLQEEFTNGFIEEMEIIQPYIIIPLSDKVEKTLIKMNKDKTIKFNLANKIPHPYYYSNFPMRYKDGLNRYIKTIQNYIQRLN